jgi:hypothetical protein
MRKAAQIEPMPESELTEEDEGALSASESNCPVESEPEEDGTVAAEMAETVETVETVEMTETTGRGGRGGRGGHGGHGGHGGRGGRGGCVGQAEQQVCQPTHRLSDH